MLTVQPLPLPRSTHEMINKNNSMQKISDGLDRHEPRLRTPRKHRHTQGQQTESEDGETDSIRSLPVTGNEFLHLDEREKVLHNAQGMLDSECEKVLDMAQGTLYIE